MLKLHGTLPVLNSTTRGSYLVTVTKECVSGSSSRSTRALLIEANQNPNGYKAVLARRRHIDVGDCQGDVFQISDDYNYLDEGDILRLDSTSGAMRCLYRRSTGQTRYSSPSNAITIVSCARSHLRHADDSWLLREAFELINVIPTDTNELILTGGEPTLYGPRLVELLNHTKRCLPNTAIHLLSNGRAFKDFEVHQTLCGCRASGLDDRYPGLR